MTNIYQQMQRGEFSHPDYEIVTKPGFNFYQLMPQGTALDSSGDHKFHLSIDPEHLEEAWDIVVDELVNSGYPQVAKVAIPETARNFANPNSIQAGKMITVYTQDGISPSVYTDILENIENRLSDANIKAGPASNADRIIGGGQYTSYRLDRDLNGEYVSSSKLTDVPRDSRHNPFGRPDPYENFSLNTRPIEISIPRIDSSTTPQEALSGFRDVLGKNNVDAIRVRSSGDIELRVPSDFSRGNLDALGIDTQEVMRTNHGDYSVLKIPANQIDAMNGNGLAGVNAAPYVAAAPVILAQPIDSILQDSSIWRASLDDSGATNVSLPVNDMGMENASRLFDELQAKGFNPIADQSSQHGPVIKFEGDDVYRLAEIQGVTNANGPGTDSSYSRAVEGDMAINNIEAWEIDDTNMESWPIEGATSEVVMDWGGRGFAAAMGTWGIVQNWDRTIDGIAAGGADSAIQSTALAVDIGAIAVDVSGDNIISRAIGSGTGAAVVGTVIVASEVGMELHNAEGMGAADTLISGVAATGGGMAGAAAGALAGAAIGSVVPIVGTAIGGAVGGIVGGVSGALGAGAASGLVTSASSIDEKLGSAFTNGIYEGVSIGGVQITGGLNGRAFENAEFLADIKNHLQMGKNLSLNDINEANSIMRAVKDDVKDLQDARVQMIEAVQDETLPMELREKIAEQLDTNENLINDMTGNLQELEALVTPQADNSLTSIFRQAHDADSLEELLQKPEYQKFLDGAESKTQMAWVPFRGTDAWERRVDELQSKVANGEDLSDRDMARLDKFELKVSDRMSNLLIKAHNGDLSDRGYQELQQLVSLNEKIDNIKSSLYSKEILHHNTNDTVVANSANFNEDLNFQTSAGRLERDGFEIKGGGHRSSGKGWF